MQPPRLAALLALCLVSPTAMAADELAPAQWLVIGPFESGSREGLVHPLAKLDGTLPSVAWLESLPPGATWPSVLADGGRVAVTRVDAQRDDNGQLTGAVKLDLKGVNWDARQDDWGTAGLLNVAVLAAGIQVESDGLFLLDAARCAGTVGGIAVAGDPYGAGIARSVLRLPTGTHDVLLTSGGYGGEREFRFTLTRLRPEDGVLQVVSSDILLPDAVAGSAGNAFAGIPILNLTNDWIDGITVEISGNGVAGRASVPFPLAPRSPMKVSVPLAWSALPSGLETLPLTIRVLSPHGGALASSAMSVRAPGAPRVDTFVSAIDRSTQAMGVFEGAPASKDGPGQLVLSLHGAGVGPLGQASAYAGRPFTVVAPTNRRPYGFDWHDWGRLDALEVLDLALARFPVDPARVVLAGQSMGGHGAWVLGTHHADRFCALTPAAGWMGYDSVVPFTMRRSTHVAPAELQAIMMRALAPGRVAQFLDNLQHLPTLAYHGGSDDNISPMNARMLVGLAERRGLDARLCEAAGKGHWSDIDIDPRAPADSANACVDRAHVESFWRTAPPVTPPRAVRIVATDLDAGRSAHWIEILAQERMAADTLVDATLGDDAATLDVVTLDVVTRNVTAFAIRGERLPSLPSRVRATIDGQALDLTLPSPTERVILSRSASGWRSRLEPLPAIASPNAHPGSLVKALFEPFLIVVGTSAHEQRHLELARLLAETWWVRGNGLAPIVRDVDLTPRQRDEYNLVLLGRPDENAETARLAPSLEISATRGGMRLGDRLVSGPSLASMHWEPVSDRPAREVLVLQSTDDDSAALLPLMSPFAPGAGWPDYVVATPRVRELGWGGLAAAGFWNADFRFTPDDAWTANATRPLPAEATAASSRATPRR